MQEVKILIKVKGGSGIEFRYDGFGKIKRKRQKMYNVRRLIE
jgi:hypothetical protein